MKLIIYLLIQPDLKSHMSIFIEDCYYNFDLVYKTYKNKVLIKLNLNIMLGYICAF